MRAVAAVLALATSAFALSVTAPTNTTGFNNEGQNTVSWNRVSTDPQNFTIVLVNKSVFPNYEQVLDALVDAGDNGGTIQVNPPSTGWPQSGTGFQINLVADAQHLDTLLAQSGQFTIHAPDASASVSASVSGSASSGTSSVSRTVLSISQTGAATGSGAASNPTGSAPSSTSDTTTSPTPNGAASFGVQAAFFGIVALAGAYLA